MKSAIHIRRAVNQNDWRGLFIHSYQLPSYQLPRQIQTELHYAGVTGEHRIKAQTPGKCHLRQKRALGDRWAAFWAEIVRTCSQFLYCINAILQKVELFLICHGMSELYSIRGGYIGGLMKDNELYILAQCYRASLNVTLR